jgi:DnaJ-class molecular chaperone
VSGRHRGDLHIKRPTGSAAGKENASQAIFLKIKEGRIEMDKNFAPGKYGMVICPLCDGKGFLIKDSEGTGVFVRNVCVKCGGFGAIKEEEEVLGSPGN